MAGLREVTFATEPPIARWDYAGEYGRRDPTIDGCLDRGTRQKSAHGRYFQATPRGDLPMLS
jgi:hypothetical protein